MTLILNGTDGLSDVDGSASTPAIRGTDTNTGMFFGTDIVGLSTGGSERMRIDSSGNVGIGTTSPGAVLDVRSSSNAAAFRTSDATAANNAGSWIFNTASGTAASRVANILLDGNGGNASGSDYFVLSHYGDNHVEIRNYSNGYMNFYTNNSERMRIDSSGNVGIGTNSPGVPLDVTGVNGIRVYSSSSYSQKIEITYDLSNTSGNQTIFQIITDQNNAYISTVSNKPMLFRTNDTERARFTSAGGFEAKQYVKTDTYFWSAGVGNAGGLYLGATGSANGQISQASNGSASTATYIGNQQITTSSDVRLKENIVDSQRNAVEILNKLRVVDFTWNDPSDQCVNNKASRGVWTGLIAQEAINHVPWLVNKPLEDEESDGTKNYWLMDYGHTVPLLVKAIQELKAELDTVKAQNAAFEARLAALEAK